MQSFISHKKNSTVLEWLTGFLCLIGLGYLLRPLLFTGETTLVHDNLYWNLPIFHYFAINVMNGHFPWWNPFTHGGEPFFPLMAQLQLWDPTAFLTVFIGQVFTKDTVVLFNWTRFVQSVVMVFGVYLVLRQWAKHRLTKLLLLPILFFSSFFLGSFHQDGILTQFLWTPFVAYFSFRIVFRRDTRWILFLWLGIFIGLNWQSYHFVGVWVWLLFFLLGTVFFHRDLVFDLLHARNIIPKLGVTIGIIVLMALPNIALLREGSHLVFPLRMLPQNFEKILMKESGILPSEADPSFVDIGIRVPYRLIPYTGAFVKMWEIFQMLSPNANPNIHGWVNSATWGEPSEAYIYLGILTWAIALFGFFLGQSSEKKLWLLLSLGFGLLMLGPPGGLHHLLYYLYPPLWFLRHTTLLVLFFLFGFLYFFVLGLDRLLAPVYWNRPNLSQIAVFTAYTSFLVLSGYAMSLLKYPVFKFPLTNFLFLLIAACATAGFFCRHRLGRGGLFLGLLIAQISVLFILTPTPLQAFLYLGAVFFLPATVFLYLRSVPTLSHLLIAACLVGDLLYGVSQSALLYQFQPHPARLLSIPKTTTPVFSLERYPYPSYPSFFYGHQVPRYLSMFYEKPYAFSPVIYFGSDTTAQHPMTTAHALSSPRWNSLIMLKDYFKLVHEAISPADFDEIFGIHAGILQAKQGFLPLESGSLQALGQRLGEKSLHSLLSHFVFIPKESSVTFSKVTPAHFLPLRYRIEHYDYQTLTLTTEATAPQVLYWADGYHPAWHAEIDGVPTQVFKANENFKAVSLPAGTHHLRFAFDPKEMEWSLAIFFAIPLLVLALTLFSIFPLRAFILLRRPVRVPA